MQAVIDACKNRKINAKVVLVISNNSDAYALERAKGKDRNYHVSEYKYKEVLLISCWNCWQSMRLIWYCLQAI